MIVEPRIAALDGVCPFVHYDSGEPSPTVLPDRHESTIMNSLSSAQRKKLRAIAHHLDPVVYVGKQGVTEALMSAIGDALLSHELIKVKFNDFKGEKKALSAQIAENSGAEIAGLIGNVLILYREHPDPEKRKIETGG